MIQTLTDALSERGYDNLTAVQEAVTNPDLRDADLLVSAQTGSGKTVGFGLAIAPTLLGDADVLGPAAAPLALIVAPTRELAFQVMRELSWLYAKAGARVASCVGGMDMRDERRALDRGAHIVVGTPGRLRDHIQRGSLDMSSLRAIVLDEADEMLDLGFREDLEFMLGEAPQDRRTLMFSATVPPTIAKLAQKYQRDAVRVTTLSGTSQHADISYQALRVAQHDAENAIINVLRFHDAQNAIVFANTRAMVSRLTARLSNRGFSVVALSGELSQTERTHALQAMRDGRARVCVATDVAARGIDLPNLELVIHAELPSNAEGLLHRSGRTGRAGRKGISTLIVPQKIANKAERLLKFAKIQAEWMTPPSADDILRKDEERLLADPVWHADTTPEQKEFAAKLLALHSPEQIAAAYLALYRSRQSAPEELSAPDARPEPKERKPFGPSAWFALSVGRDDRAEPRWLLPLLCRAGNLDKDAIGAIRIQQSESYVELTQASVPGFLAAIGDGGVLEEGVKVRQLDAAPDLGRAPGKPAPAPRKPARDFRPQTEGAQDESRAFSAPVPTPAQTPAKPREKAAPAPKAPSKMAEAVSEGSVTPYRKAKTHDDAKPSYSKAKPKASGKPSSYEKPAGKPRGKTGEKPRGKSFGKPGDKGTFAGEKRFKAAGAGAGNSEGKPAAPRANASDTSKRFSPPGGAGKSKPGGPGKRPRKPFAGPSGNEPPKRGKR